VLGRALARAHNIGGVNGLVGRHHHKALHAVLVGQLGGGVRSQNICFDGLLRVILHQGHVLVGRGVKHHLGLVGAKDLRHALGIGHAGNGRLDVGVVG